MSLPAKKKKSKGVKKRKPSMLRQGKKTHQPPAKRQRSPEPQAAPDATEHEHEQEETAKAPEPEEEETTTRRKYVYKPPLVVPCDMDVFCEAVRNGTTTKNDAKPSLFAQKPRPVGSDPNKELPPMRANQLRQTLYWLTGASTLTPSHIKLPMPSLKSDDKSDDKSDSKEEESADQFADDDEVPRQVRLGAPAFSTIAIVAVSALTRPLYRQAGGDALCAAMRRVFGDVKPVPVTAPGSKTAVYRFLDTILRDGSLLPEVEPRHDMNAAGKPETADDLVLSEAAFTAAEYPRPAESVTLMGDYTFDVLETRERPADVPADESRHVLALDCEMCQTAYGLEIARVSVVDANGKVLYDTTVLPTHEVTDYLTRYSGITEETLAATTTTLEEARSTLLERFIFRDTVLVGHSLENDLAKLHISHRNVIDTSILFGRPTGGKYKLRELARHFLRREIQVEGRSHDSAEDAIACLDLVNLRLRNGRYWTALQLGFNPRDDPPGAPTPSPSPAPAASDSSQAAAAAAASTTTTTTAAEEAQNKNARGLTTLYSCLADRGVDCAIFDMAEHHAQFVPVMYERNAHIACRTVQSDPQAVADACRLLASAAAGQAQLPRVLWVRLDSLYFRARAIETALNKNGPGEPDQAEYGVATAEYASGLRTIDGYVGRIYDALPDDALLVLLAMDAPCTILPRLRREYLQTQRDGWTNEQEKLLEKRVAQARDVFIRLRVKHTPKQDEEEQDDEEGEDEEKEEEDGEKEEGEGDESGDDSD